MTLESLDTAECTFGLYENWNSASRNMLLGGPREAGVWEKARTSSYGNAARDEIDGSAC